jgi:hypothetical protein
MIYGASMYLQKHRCPHCFRIAIADGRSVLCHGTKMRIWASGVSDFSGRVRLRDVACDSYDNHTAKQRIRVQAD